MSTISTVNPTNATVETSMPQSSTMGKDEFLRLLITQLKNQDPLNPMDAAEFTAQLAQFSSLEQLYNLNDQFDAFNSSQLTMNNMKSVDLIGKEITTEGKGLVVDGDSTHISYTLDEAVKSGTIEIYNSDGKVAATLDIGSQDAGEHSVEWDCSAMERGNYSFEVAAQGSDGKNVSYTPRMQGIVTGVIFKEDGVYLAVGDEEIAAKDVASVQ